MNFDIGRTTTEFLTRIYINDNPDLDCNCGIDEIDKANPKFFWYAQFTYNMMIYITDIPTRNMAEKEYLEAVCNMA